MTKRLVIGSNDFNLFDGELNSYEYEYFCKHTGAFKRFMQEEPVEQRQEFLDAFCEYSYNHIELRAAIATMSDPKKKFIESFRQYVQEAFVNAKFSAAKQFLNDSVIVARNRHMISYMDSHSYAKDPFFHKETRDVFRRLFGEPTEAGTCVKVICILPLYVRFAGSICRYLKRWLDMEESMYPPMLVKSSKKNRDKKAMKELAIANRLLRTASSHQTKPAVDSSKTLSTAQKSSSTGGNTKTVPAGQQSTAPVAKTNGDSAEKAEDDLSNFYYDMHERKQRKREERKRGKRHEIACQHPCHGKGKGCCSQTGGHDHHHHHHHDAPSPSQEQLMACLCEKHRVLAEAKIAEKKAALEKHQQSGKCEARKMADKKSEDKSSGDNMSESKSSENKSSEMRSSEEKDSEDKSSEGKSSGDKCSVVENLEDKSSEEVNAEDEEADGKSFDVKDFEEKSSEGTHNEKDSEGETSKKKDSEGPTAESKDSEGQATENNISEEQTSDKEDSVEQTSHNKDSEGQIFELKDSEGQAAEVKNSEGQTSENKDEQQVEENKKSDENEVKTPEVKSPTGKTKHSHKRISENGVVSSDSDCDAAVERFVNTTFPELHLCKPHPNQQYENMMAEERAKVKLKESKFRKCASCGKKETEIKTFKKCQKCKGKGTKFYCSRDCQKLDWTKHRLEH